MNPGEASIKDGRAEVIADAIAGCVQTSALMRKVAMRTLPTRSRELIGGVFGRAGFVMTSMVLPWQSGGLHALQFLVVDASSGLVLGSAEEKAAALARARLLLTALRPDELAAARAAFLKVLADEEAAARQESARIAADDDAAVPPPRSIPKRRREIFDKSEGKCHYCATPLSLDGKWHIEHMQPKALLGPNEKSNLVAACVPCNTKKRDRTAEEFIASRGVNA